MYFKMKLTFNKAIKGILGLSMSLSIFSASTCNDVVEENPVQENPYSYKEISDDQLGESCDYDKQMFDLEGNPILENILFLATQRYLDETNLEETIGIEVVERKYFESYGGVVYLLKMTKSTPASDFYLNVAFSCSSTLDSEYLDLSDSGLPNINSEGDPNIADEGEWINRNAPEEVHANEQERINDDYSDLN